MNKYARVAQKIIDLHGYTTKEAANLLEQLLLENIYKHVRLITGKGAFRDSGPVLRTFVENYLRNRQIKFNYSKLNDGGEGALEVFFS